MNVNKRDRGDIGAGRETVQRAPRSGGRTAAQWAPAEGAEAVVRGIGAGRRAERLNAARGRGATPQSAQDSRAADQEGPQRVERLSSLERIERRERAAAEDGQETARRSRDTDRDLRAERIERADRKPVPRGQADRDRTPRVPADRGRTARAQADRGRSPRGQATQRAREQGVREQEVREQRVREQELREPRGREPRERVQRDRVQRGPARAAEPVDLSVARGRRYVTDGSAALEPQPEEIHVLVDPAPVHEEPPAPRLRVTPPRPVSVPRAPFIAGILIMVVAGVVGILLINTQTNKNAFRLDELQKQQAALDVQQQELEKQIEEYESPNYLIAHAKKLGLVKSEDPAFITLPDGKVIGVPKPAGGKPAITSQQESGR